MKPWRFLMLVSVVYASMAQQQETKYNTMDQQVQNRSIYDFQDHSSRFESHARSLQNICSRGMLKLDAVWYELELLVISSTRIECSGMEWSVVRDAFQDAILNANLVGSGLLITQMRNHLCHDVSTAGDRFLLDNNNHNDEWVPRDLEMRDNADWIFRFHLPFLGGGKCFFCRKDDKDHEHRRRLSQPARQLRGGGSIGYHNDNSTSTGFSRQEVRLRQVSESRDSPIQQQRRTQCGGCFHLDFEKDGNGHKISGTPYIANKEYWDSHGVKIRAFVKPGKKKGYTPNRMARIYDTSVAVTDDNSGDPDLGSPNRDCRGGGPGIGAGGAPRLNGRWNPGANCEPQGNVLIIQEKDKPEADDSSEGGRIAFDFRYPVTLRSVGIMDADDVLMRWLEVTTVDGDVHKYSVKGFGQNSIETIEFNRKKVKKLVVRIPSSGAVRFVDFCHECGEEEEIRQRAIDEYYPDSSERDYENKASVAHFEDLVPKASNAVAKKLEQAVRQFTRDRNHCFYRKTLSVDVELVPSTPVNANDCQTG